MNVVLTQYLDLSEYSLGIDDILKSLVDSFDGNFLSRLGVLGRKDVSICATAD